MPTALPRLAFEAKFAYALIIILALGYLLNVGQDIICPLLIAMLFAILLRPVASFLQERLRFPNALACLVSVLLFSLLIGGVFYFISTQIAHMADDWEKIKENVSLHYQHLQTYITETFNVSKAEQDKFVKETTNGPLGGGKKLVGATLMSFTNALLSMLIVPIYMFLILLYRTHFASFLSKLFAEKHHERLKDVIATIKVSVQSYILGLMLELLIVSSLTTIGFWIIGVKYAILLGVITGLLNLIPYVGIMTACVLSIIASLTGSSDLSIIIGIIVVNLVVQFIDNNFLVPMVVSSKVEINSLATIVGIIVAGTIAGVAGMFLAIPMMAMAKVIFDRVDSLQAWGYFLGDDLPKSFSWRKRKRTSPIEKIVRK
ncbi:AI-2E family transporter [Flavobacterium wongokense]|uniref:AI-2E family transporter n=1 Tax=Flavobacterium wongokense TaxID=2910674 RepID=UPI001F1B0637|nr:AI-2E family transporter [Flavobacterium sp. WG47]MCF6131688.1 AI-2E family transporter [Flavobacterium sp. WG47]